MSQWIFYRFHERRRRPVVHKPVANFCSSSLMPKESVRQCARWCSNDNESQHQEEHYQKYSNSWEERRCKLKRKLQTAAPRLLLTSKLRVLLNEIMIENPARSHYYWQRGQSSSVVVAAFIKEQIQSATVLTSLLLQYFASMYCSTLPSVLSTASVCNWNFLQQWMNDEDRIKKTKKKEHELCSGLA